MSAGSLTSTRIDRDLATAEAALVRAFETIATEDRERANRLAAEAASLLASATRRPGGSGS